jgi:hypothetical protein
MALTCLFLTALRVKIAQNRDCADDDVVVSWSPCDIKRPLISSLRLSRCGVRA